MNNSPFSVLGATIANATLAYSKLSKALSDTMFKPFFKVEERDAGYLITFYDPERVEEIKEWMRDHGYEAETVNGMGWHVWDVDQDTAVLAKLTWGGAA
jgi:hypothetical protein